MAAGCDTRHDKCPQEEATAPDKSGVSCELGELLLAQRTTASESVEAAVEAAALAVVMTWMVAYGERRLDSCALSGWFTREARDRQEYNDSSAGDAVEILELTDVACPGTLASASTELSQG